MKKTFNLIVAMRSIAIIAIVAVIGFSIAACGGGDDGGSGTAPTITTASLPNGTVGTAYSQTLAATGDTPITWSLESGTLPTGLNLLGNGSISGTPTAAATSTFTVKATNAKGNNTKSLSITIAAGSSGGTAPTITTASLPNGTVGTAYSQTLAASGDTPITWTIDGTGTLPAGLSLATTGVISGTPTTAGASTFTVKATNAAGNITKSLSITIAASGGGDPTPTVSYIITGSGTTFTATKNGATIGTANKLISDVIGYINTDANGANVGIQFGNGTSVLDIGNNSVSFGSYSGTWGIITLSGKITSGCSNSAGPVAIPSGISVISTADITATGIIVYGISNFGTLTINGGTVSTTNEGGRSGIRNYGGTVIINSGTISSTGYDGLSNEVGSDYGTVTINGGTVSTANVNNTNQYAIRNAGGCTLTITGGTVSATGVNANGGIYNSGTLNISNGTFRSTGASGTAGNTIYNGNGGTLTISGGTFESAYSTIYNFNATMTMTGGTVSTTYNNANGRAIVGSGSNSNVTINGGTVSAPSNGYAVYNDDNVVFGTGTVTIGTSAVINGRKYPS